MVARVWGRSGPTRRQRHARWLRLRRHISTPGPSPRRRLRRRRRGARREARTHTPRPRQRQPAAPEGARGLAVAVTPPSGAEHLRRRWQQLWRYAAAVPPPPPPPPDPPCRRPHMHVCGGGARGGRHCNCGLDCSRTRLRFSSARLLPRNWGSAADPPPVGDNARGVASHCNRCHASRKCVALAKKRPSRYPSLCIVQYTTVPWSSGSPAGSILVLLGLPLRRCQEGIA